MTTFVNKSLNASFQGKMQLRDKILDVFSN